jgi:hypothetical protein
MLFHRASFEATGGWHPELFTHSDNKLCFRAFLGVSHAFDSRSSVAPPLDLPFTYPRPSFVSVHGLSRPLPSASQRFQRIARGRTPNVLPGPPTSPTRTGCSTHSRPRAGVVVYSKETQWAKLPTSKYVLLSSCFLFPFFTLLFQCTFNCSLAFMTNRIRPLTHPLFLQISASMTVAQQTRTPSPPQSSSHILPHPTRLASHLLALKTEREAAGPRRPSVQGGLLPRKRPRRRIRFLTMRTLSQVHKSKLYCSQVGHIICPNLPFSRYLVVVSTPMRGYPLLSPLVRTGRSVPLLCFAV